MNIAVLMSTFNGEKFLQDQIESILNQKCSHTIDLLVRDDGSTDGTIEILDKFKKIGKLKWFSGKNVGPAASFIDLFNKCSSKYDFYALSDQDDVWDEDKLEHGVSCLTGHGNVLLYCSNARLVDKCMHNIGRNVYKNNPICDLFGISCEGGLLGCTMLFNSRLMQIIKKAKINETSSIIMHDFLLAEVCTAVGGSILFDKEPHMSYRQHTNNVIGVSTGTFNIIKSRFNAIFVKARISISEQAAFVLENFSDSMSEKNKRWLSKVATYRHSLLSATILGTSKCIKYPSLNMEIKTRCSIILRNR